MQQAFTLRHRRRMICRKGRPWENALDEAMYILARVKFPLVRAS